MKNSNKSRRKTAKKITAEELSNVSGGNRVPSPGVRETFERIAPNVNRIIDNMTNRSNK